MNKPQIPALDDWGPEVASLHRENIVIDSHNDSIVRHIVRHPDANFAGRDDISIDTYMGPIRYLRYPGPIRDLRESIISNDLAAPPAKGSDHPVQVNLPLMRAGGLDVAYCAVDCTRAWNNQMSYALDGWGWLLAQVSAVPDQATMAATADEILGAKAAGKSALVLTLENSDGLERSLNALEVIHRLGVRAITVTHNIRSWAGDGNGEAKSGGGLTEWGRSLVKGMNRFGMLVDVSHSSERTFWDVLDTSSDPVVATHSSCRSLCDDPRNFTDEQLRALAENGGVIGIAWVPHYIHPESPSLERLLDHFDHAVEVAGINHVGLGSDFDGGGTVLADASQLPSITAGLMKRGYTHDHLRRILGENHLRLFRQVCG